MDGRPNRGEPVNISSCAGAWLNWSVYIERTMHNSPASCESPGSSELIHVPCGPTCANWCGLANSLGCPLMNAKRSPSKIESGHGLRSHFRSSVLWSNKSCWGGEPAMCK